MFAVIDAEGVLIDGEFLIELAKIYGKEKEVEEITLKGLRGEIKWEEGLKKRVNILKGASYGDALKVASNMALMKGVATKSPEETIITNLKDSGLPDTVLLRSDGTGLYLTSDLSLTVHKFEKYKLNSSIWVVMSHQDLYFKQLFKVLNFNCF